MGGNTKGRNQKRQEQEYAEAELLPAYQQDYTDKNAYPGNHLQDGGGIEEQKFYHRSY